MKTAIIFDLDGTLLDTLQDLTDAVNHSLRHYGCPERTPMEVRSYVGNGVEYLMRKALPGKATDPEIGPVMETYRQYYAAHNKDKTCPYAGIVDALKEIRKEFPIAVVSNKPDYATKPLCREFFGEDIFALGQLDDCPRKPAPDMVYKAMQALGAEKCIYVGDSEVDVLTAKNAGAPCLSVLWGFRDKDYLAQEGATHFCDDPKKLYATLKEMMENG